MYIIILYVENRIYKYSIQHNTVYFYVNTYILLHNYMRNVRAASRLENACIYIKYTLVPKYTIVYNPINNHMHLLGFFAWHVFISICEKLTFFMLCTLPMAFPLDY